MTDNQIINSLVKFALEVHYPYSIPVGDLLLEKYHCDHRRKHILLNQIEHYNLMELIDKESGSEMKFTKDGLIVANSDNPIEAMNKLIEDNKPKISTNKLTIIGDIKDSPIIQGDKNQFFERLPSKTPNLKEEYIDITKSKNPASSFKSIFKEYFQYIAWTATILGSGLAYWKFFR